jgi:hypothetical protein
MERGIRNVYLQKGRGIEKKTTETKCPPDGSQ